MKRLLLAVLIIVNTTFILPHIETLSGNKILPYFIGMVLLIYVVLEVYDYLKRRENINGRS